MPVLAYPARRAFAAAALAALGAASTPSTAPMSHPHRRGLRRRRSPLSPGPARRNTELPTGLPRSLPGFSPRPCRCTRLPGRRRVRLALQHEHRLRGQITAQCSPSTDGDDFRPETAATHSDGQPFNAAITPYAVLPRPDNPNWSYRGTAISLGEVAAVMTRRVRRLRRHRPRTADRRSVLRRRAPGHRPRPQARRNLQRRHLHHLPPHPPQPRRKPQPRRSKQTGSRYAARRPLSGGRSRQHRPCRPT